MQSKSACGLHRRPQGLRVVPRPACGICNEMMQWTVLLHPSFIHANADVRRADTFEADYMSVTWSECRGCISSSSRKLGFAAWIPHGHGLRCQQYLRTLARAVVITAVNCLSASLSTVVQLRAGRQASAYYTAVRSKL